MSRDTALGPGYTRNTMSEQPVSLVIPGRNCASTIRQCLEAVVGMLDCTPLAEILFVDDGSTDDTVKIVGEFPVRCVPGDGRGPGAARNIGWRAASCPLVWFVDSDCVCEPDALTSLLPQIEDPKVGAASGSYGIMNPESLLACLIHEEIIERHLNMPQRVDFLATFNVVYRRDVLDEVDGFDERLLKGQDAELSWRVMAAGYELRFAIDSRVKHYHSTNWLKYLRTQKDQGYWRVWLHLLHSGHAAGDSYSNWVDHVQPPLAMLTLASVPLAPFGQLIWIPMGLLTLLEVCQIPMTWRLMKRLRHVKYFFFAGMSFTRAFWRGYGMTRGTLAYIAARFRGSNHSEGGKDG